MRKMVFTGLLLAWACRCHAADEGQLTVKVDGRELITYQQAPMTAPKGGDKFKASNFFHPLKTPAGFVVTDLQPGDHMHHLGLWWPWKHVEVEGRKILCWEMQSGDGIIQAQGGERTPEGFTARSIYVDRKAEGGPRTVLNETLNVRLSAIVSKPATGYSMDMEIVHEPAIDKSVTVTVYRYSGFALRGTPHWNRDNSTVVTSEGKDYSQSNFTRARWLKVEGTAAAEAKAGVLLMSHPGNQDHPELLRTWDPKTHNGAIFVNFNTVQSKPWVLEPGQRYARNYRVFVYDGELSAGDAETMWREYAAGAKLGCDSN